MPPAVGVGLPPARYSGIAPLPLVFAGSSSSEKSPFRIAKVGTVLFGLAVTYDEITVPCASAKKNSLFFQNGPPIVAPNWLR